MAISSDWNIDYTNKLISHIDGVLTFDNGVGTAPVAGQYIQGATSGAVGKVLSVTGNAAAGTATLTNVIGRWANNEKIHILSELNFDAITAGNGGFQVGDTIAGNASASTIVVAAIEYNMTTTAGWGKIFGRPMSAAFTNNEQLNVSGGTADVADADGVGTDNDALWEADVDGTLAVPGTANTNNSVIIHYDAGTIAIPADAKIEDATSTAYGWAQAVYGATATGSIRVVDSTTTGGAWTDGNTLNLVDVLFYKNLVAGKVFSVGDVVHGATSAKEGRVLAVINDGDNTGKLILAGKTGVFTNLEDIQVKESNVWTKYGEVENLTNVLAAATLNIPSGVRSVQLAPQGGIYAGGTSLNIVRSSNALYTYIMDTIDELLQLDDTVPMKANVKNQLYTLTNGWKIPDHSFRFLENGSWQDSGKANIWTNYQSLGSIADIGNWGFYYSITNPTPQPNLYIEQDGTVLSQFWLEGNVNVNIKVKTNTDPAYIDPTVAALGQLINSGTVTWFAREYLRTYDHFQTTTVGGTAPIPFATAVDLNNTTGTYRVAYVGAGGYLVGEEIVGATTGARGIVTAESLAGDTLDYVLKTSAQFAGGENIVGQVGGVTVAENGVTSLVAGYGTNIRIMTVDRKLTGGVSSGAWVYGELLTQAVTGWTGYFMQVDASDDLYVEDVYPSTGTINNVNEITGDVSGSTYTPAGNASETTVPYNLGDGSGIEDYTAVIAANITGGSAQTILKCYEWAKYLTAKESTTIQGGPGTSIGGVQGRVYRTLDSTWAEVKASPWGTFAGGKLFGARGVFIIKEDLDSADIQNFQLINNAGTTRTPPNLQALTVSVPGAGVRVAVFRTAVASSTVIQRTEFQVGVVGAGNNQAGDSTVLVAAQDRAVSPLPADVPDTATLRILSPNNTGNYILMDYTSVDRATNIFTLGDTIGNYLIAAGEASADLVLADNVGVSLYEGESAGASVSNIIQYVAPGIYLYWVARKKGYLPAEGTATFSATGASIASNMQADDIVNLP